MKKFCHNHYVAFEASEGCLDCAAKEAEKLAVNKVTLTNNKVTLTNIGSREIYICSEPIFTGTIKFIIGQYSFPIPLFAKTEPTLEEPGIVANMTDKEKRYVKNLKNPCAEIELNQGRCDLYKEAMQKVIGQMTTDGYFLL